MTTGFTITPRDAQRAVRPVVRFHNQEYPMNSIRTRVHNGRLEVGVKGKRRDWFPLTCTGQVQAFADGVSDVEAWGRDDIPPRTEPYGTAEEQEAYEFGITQGSPG